MSTNFDTSDYRTIRLYVSCNGPGGDCNNVVAELITNPGGHVFDLDEFNVTSGPVIHGTTTRTYDVPGADLQLSIVNGSPDTVAVSYALEG